jgi:hypothetical protein
LAGTKVLFVGVALELIQLKAKMFEKQSTLVVYELAKRCNGDVFARPGV